MAFANVLHQRQISPYERQPVGPYDTEYDDTRSHGQRLESRSTERPQPRQCKQESSQVGLLYDRISADDLSDATPEPREVVVKREMSVLEVEVDSDKPARETVAEKRRRLLRKGDWVGINIQKPIHLKFSCSKTSDNVGRRRKVSDDHKARYNDKRTRASSSISGGTKDHNRRRVPSRESSMAPPARNDVRISIGGEVVPPGASSSSRPSRSLPELRPQFPSFNRSLTHSSDVMLLDDNEAHIGGQHSVSHSDSESTSGGKLRGHAVAEQFLASQSSQQAMIGHGPSPAVPDTIDSPQLRASRSSSLPLHHPVPKRLSQLISSTSLGDACSVTAQVGRIRPKFTSSQAAENEVWKTWMASSDSPSAQNQSPTYGENNEDAHNRSPFYSVYEHDGRLRSGLESPSISVASSAHDNLRSITHNSPSPELGADTTGEQMMGNSQDSSMSRQPPEITKRLDRSMPKDSRTMSHNEDKPRRSLQTAVAPNNLQATKPTKTTDDAEEIWRNFVFGDDSDDSVGGGDETDLRAAGTHTTNTIASSKAPEQIGRRSQTFKNKEAVLPSDADHSGPSADSTAAVRGSKTSSYCSENDYPGQDSSSQPLSEHEILGSSKEASGSAQQGFNSSDPSTNAASLASRAVVAQSEPASEMGGTPARFGRKVVFTRPNRFEGSRSPALPAPLHIGAKFILKSHNSRERDVYSLVGTDEMEEDVESIEDD